jgi:hypothetical protein
MKGRKFTPGPKWPGVWVPVHEAAIVARLLPW